MKVHLIRHAEAIDRSQEIIEAHRHLTCRGRTRFRRVAASLKKLGIDPDIIITSPLIRAVQTADILAETLRFSGELLVSPLLASGFDRSRLFELLFGHAQAKEVVLVGHEPDFGELVRDLLDIPFGCAMKKGGTVSLMLDPVSAGSGVTFLCLVTGGGKVITNPAKARERLQIQ